MTLTIKGFVTALPEAKQEGDFVYLVEGGGRVGETQSSTLGVRESLASAQRLVEAHIEKLYKKWDRHLAETHWEYSRGNYSKEIDHAKDVEFWGWRTGDRAHGDFYGAIIKLRVVP